MILQALEPAFQLFFFFNDTATTEIYTLSLHDALPISPENCRTSAAEPKRSRRDPKAACRRGAKTGPAVGKLANKAASGCWANSWLICCCHCCKVGIKTAVGPPGLTPSGNKLGRWRCPGSRTGPGGSARAAAELTEGGGNEAGGRTSPAGWAGLSARLPAWASAGGNHRLAGCRAPRPSPGLGGNRLSSGCAVAGSAWSADSPVAADAPPAGPAPGLRHRRAPRASTDPGV